MQPDGRLAGAGTALHDQRRPRVACDETVLIRLDRRDDVPHPGFPGALELLQEEVVDGEHRVGDGPVERLVADVEERPALRTEATAESDAVRLGRGRGVERSGGRRLPVHDDRRPALVVHPAPTHVGRVAHRLDVDPAEAQPLFGVLECLQATGVPGVHSLACDVVDDRVARPHERVAHAVETVVGVVEIGLLGGDVWVRHGLRA